MMIMLTIANLIWILYSVFEGVREGFYWKYKSTNNKESQFEVYPIFSMQRSLVLLLIGVLLFPSIGWFSVISVLSMLLMFSFFHNGTYYKTKNKLDNGLYELGWMDHSPTTKTKITKLMTYRNRTILMIIGVLLEVFMCLFIR